MTVVMMRQMSLDNQVEKSEKKNDQDQVDGMRQEVYLVPDIVHVLVQAFHLGVLADQV